MFITYMKLIIMILWWSLNKQVCICWYIKIILAYKKTMFNTYHKLHEISIFGCYLRKT